mmetsp:Transcript_8854/g.26741  ORF Transcript_8854/g.26741 Transcript_8854/m.26741 type:complete len:95 (-) Transcript_8854:260-544(-)
MGKRLCSTVWSDIKDGKVPGVNKRSHGVLCFILNVIFPGLGTAVAGLLADRPSALVVGLLQFLTVPLLLIGWVWSIYWGYLIYQKSKSGYLSIL